MALVGTVVNAAVGLVLGWLGKGRLDQMQRQIDGGRGELRAGIDGVRAELGAIRSDRTGSRWQWERGAGPRTPDAQAWHCGQK